MHELLIPLMQRGYIIPIVAITMGGLIAITAILAGCWQRLRRIEIEAALKHKMLDQGMSADEIQKVLQDGHRGRGCGGAHEREHVVRS